MNIKPLLFVVCAAFVCFTACKKDNDAPVINTSIDSLNFINAYSIPVNIYLNGSRLNNSYNLSAGGSSGYYTVPSGQQAYQVKKVFNSSTSVVPSLFSYSANLIPHNYYSLFIAGATDSTAFVIPDKLPLGLADSNKCEVRFVNASPGAGAFDFSIGGISYTNQAFKTYSDFMQVDTASLSPLILFRAGTTDTLLSGHYPLLQGYIYTFFAKGSPGGTGNSALSIGVTVNAQ